MLLGWALVHGVAGLMKSDQFLFPVVIRPRTYAWAALAVLAAGLGQRAGWCAGASTGWTWWQALKTRE
jgi:hypothetical protein